MTLERYGEIGDKIEQLKNYAELEGSEIGEVSMWLCEFFESYNSYVSDEFLEVLAKEIESQLEGFEQNSEIVDEEITPTPRKVKKLVWRS